MRGALLRRYERVRASTLSLVRPLSDADMTIQTADFASPGKWHLAHTTWFFEEFVLARRDGYRWYDERYRYLFNSYYNGIGERQPRGRRGVLSRPTLEEVLRYRSHVDGQMMGLLEEPFPGDEDRIIELGLHHEQQHQELILTDILHTLSHNPLRPAYRKDAPVPAGPQPRVDPAAGGWLDFPGGLTTAGHEGEGFAFDNEEPAHRVWLAPFRLGRSLVNNGEWLDFMADGGYQAPEHWLADGWAAVQTLGWTAPLYWEQGRDGWQRFTLDGMAPVDPSDPVCHVSFFEADAFARWRGKRLPTEFEWESAARGSSLAGGYLERGRLVPHATPADGLQGLFGEVWQWTASPYLAYPGFAPAAGVVGEYNGKFMNGQYVLRGASCVTPRDHARITYRNFFSPEQRWQFSGVRLADPI